MKLVMTLLVRDEADILDANLRFHLDRGVDHILVMDNLSEDGTRDVALEFERAGLATYIHQPQDDYAQHAWVTGMARRAAVELKADWVINGDADEFWWPDSGDLKSVLGEVDTAFGAVRVPRTNFVARPDLGGIDFSQAMTVREVESVNTLGRPLPDKVCHRGLSDVTVTQGNHDASRGGHALLAVSAPLSIFHFPMRTYAQFERKIAKGGAAYARNANLPYSVGATWRDLHAVYLQDGLRRAYEAWCLDDAAIAAGLAHGRLVRDTRLRDTLSALGRNPPASHGR